MNPIEGTVNALNTLSGKIVGSPVGGIFNKVSDTLPSLGEKKVPTPFGSLLTPEVKLPHLVPVELDERKRKALTYAVGIDVSGEVIGFVPIVGDFVADRVADSYYEALSQILSPQEMIDYVKYDKSGLSSMAMARTFMKGTVK